jgi:hypothetical protein
MEREFWDNEKEFKQRKQREEDISAQEAKQRIKKKAQISVQTCAIGALSDFENAMGHLWRHGEKYENLTPEEKKLRERWKEIRESILDRAENSKRLLLREIERAEFKAYNENKYTTIIRTKENYNGR